MSMSMSMSNHGSLNGMQHAQAQNGTDLQPSCICHHQVNPKHHAYIWHPSRCNLMVLAAIKP